MKKLLDTVFVKLNGLFFKPVSPDRLSILRLVCGIYCLYYLGHLSKVNEVSAEKPDYLFDPVGIINVLSHPIDVITFKYIFIIAFVFSIFYILGLLFRFSGPVFSCLFLFIVSYFQSWSMIYHSHNIVVLTCLILGFSRSADTISLDYLFRRHFFNGQTKVRSSWHYGWPIMLIIAVTLLTYFLAGIAKVLGPSGFSWALGESVRSQVAVDAIRKDLLSSGAEPLAFFLYNKVYIFTVLGVMTLLLELCAPLVLLNKRLGYVWAILTFGMHWGIYFIMGITFRYQLAGLVFLPFFDLEKIFPWVRSRFRSGKSGNMNI